jgi:outer membrane protein assembly factor BamD (BamD/ComL family)
MIRLLFICFSISILTACSSNKTNGKNELNITSDTTSAQRVETISDCVRLKEEARKMDSTLLKANELDKKLGTKAIQVFLDFVYYCNQDTACPIFLIKTAQVSQAIQNYPQSKIALETCIKDYPNFKNKPAALFLLGQLYDEPNQLNNEKKAKEIYQQIIKEFPNSEWAVSAQGALSFIGKSDEDIVKQFEKQNK